MENSEFILEAKNIVKEFDESDGSIHRVLDGVSFGVKHREFLSIIGPSGCGKSTLIRIAVWFSKSIRFFRGFLSSKM